MYTYYGDGTLHTDSLGEKESFTYNPVGMLASDTKVDGTVISYSYDLLNRLSAKHYLQADSSQPATTASDLARATAAATPDSQTTSDIETNFTELMRATAHSVHPDFSTSEPSSTNPLTSDPQTLLPTLTRLQQILPRLTPTQLILLKVRIAKMSRITMTSRAAALS